MFFSPDSLLYFSIFLIAVEEFLQDNFLGFHYRMGIKVDQRELTLRQERTDLILGQKAKTKDSNYFYTSDGKSILFRLKHFIYNPLFTLYKHYPRKNTAPSRVMIVPVTFCQLKGEAVKTDESWLVTIRMNLGVLLFVLAALWRYVHPLPGLVGAVGGFFIIKQFGLPHLWNYFDQIQGATFQNEIESESKYSDKVTD